MVYKYTGISIDRLLEYDIYTFRVLFINAYTNLCYKTEEGRESLDQYVRCHTHQSMDTEGLKALFG